MTTAICNCPFAAKFNRHTTLLEDIGAFLLHLKATGRAASTIVCYRGYLERLADLLGKVETSHITARLLEQSVVQLQDQFPCSDVTKNKIRSVYRSLFQWLYASGLILHNPAALLNLSRAIPNHTVPITQDEVSILLDAIQHSSHPLAGRDELLIALYAFTGMRRSEALRLRVGDYDSVAKTLSLRGTKGGGNRQQPIPSRLVPLLEQYIKRLRHDEAELLFFGADERKSLSPRQAYSRFVFWKHAATIRSGLTIHSFRAGYATRLYRTTRDIWLVSRALGHSGLQTIRHYVQTDSAEIRSAVESTFGFSG